jgi:hypothetical protein
MDERPTTPTRRTDTLRVSTRSKTMAEMRPVGLNTAPCKAYIDQFIAHVNAGQDIRQFGAISYRLRPGQGIDHQCVARLIPGTARLKLNGFRDHWKATKLRQDEDCFLFRVPVASTFWQRCRGKNPGLDVQVNLQPIDDSPAALTPVRISVTPFECDAETSANLLEKVGPALLESVRNFLQAQSEEYDERHPFTENIQVAPYLDLRQIGEPIFAQGKDLSKEGMSLYLPCRPTVQQFLIQFPGGDPNHPLVAPGCLKAVVPCPDGRYELDLSFTWND